MHRVQNGWQSKNIRLKNFGYSIRKKFPIFFLVKGLFRPKTIILWKCRKPGPLKYNMKVNTFIGKQRLCRKWWIRCVRKQFFEIQQFKYRSRRNLLTLCLRGVITRFLAAACFATLSKSALSICLVWLATFSASWSSFTLSFDSVLLSFDLFRLVSARTRPQ